MHKAAPHLSPTLPWTVLSAALLATALSLAATSAAPTPPSTRDNDQHRDQERLTAIVRFAETVLEHGRDTYGKKRTPLICDYLEVNTVGLSNLTGDPKYKEAYKESLRYYFQHYRVPNGLLQKGHHGDDWPPGRSGRTRKAPVERLDESGTNP